MIRPLYEEAAQRLARQGGRASAMRERVQQGNVRLIDAAMPRRARRLVETPVIARELDRDVQDELRVATHVEQLSGKAQAQLERIVGAKGFMPSWFLQRGADLRHTVALIEARDSKGGSASGTGFMVGPGLLLTNAHVLDWSDTGGAGLLEIAKFSRATFGFEMDFNGSLQTTASFALQPDTLLLSSPWNALDYALVAVAPLSTDGRIAINSYAFNRITAELGKVVEGEPVFIVQHPNGKPKQVVINDNRVVERDDLLPYLVYEADTDAGSSGAPVFNRQWEVVALHHAPEISRDGNGRILNREGKPWTEDMGTDQVGFLSMNEGVRISQIVRDLEDWMKKLQAGNVDLSEHVRCSLDGQRRLAEALATGHDGSPVALTRPASGQSTASTASNRGSRRFPRPD